MIDTEGVEICKINNQMGCHMIMLTWWYVSKNVDSNVSNHVEYQIWEQVVNQIWNQVFE